MNIVWFSLRCSTCDIAFGILTRLPFLWHCLPCLAQPLCHLPGTLQLYHPVLHFGVKSRVSLWAKLIFGLSSLCTPLRWRYAAKPAYYAWFANCSKLRTASILTILVCFGAPNRLNQHGTIIEISFLRPVYSLPPKCIQLKYSLTSMRQAENFPPYGLTTILHSNEVWKDLLFELFYVSFGRLYFATCSCKERTINAL